jgi:hypothetical protein
VPRLTRVVTSHVFFRPCRDAKWLPLACPLCFCRGPAPTRAFWFQSAPLIEALVNRTRCPQSCWTHRRQAVSLWLGAFLHQRRAAAQKLGQRLRGPGHTADRTSRVRELTRRTRSNDVKFQAASRDCRFPIADCRFESWRTWNLAFKAWLLCSLLTYRGIIQSTKNQPKSQIGNRKSAMARSGASH